MRARARARASERESARERARERERARNQLQIVKMVLIDSHPSRGRRYERARARVTSLLKINKNFKVGKYNARSGNTASESDRDCNAELAARRGGSKSRNYSKDVFY